MQHLFNVVLRNSKRAAATAIGLAYLSFTPTSAHADARTDARVHFQSGMRLIADGNIDAGVAELETAYEILPHPHVLYNIARAYGEAGRYEDAVEYFERYLAGDPPDREEVRGFLEAIQERLAQAQSTAPASGGETPSTAGAQATPAPVAPATPEEILALEESATQIETLGEATDSEALRQRARSLRQLAQQLRAGLAAAPAETTTSTTETGGGTAAGSQTGTETATTTGAGAETGQATALALGQEQQALYDETVVSASRFAQNPLDAPNAIANVTRQDIRLSGLMNPGELIRRTPGAHVLSTGVGDVQIGMRGFNQRFSPRVLTLVNGRSMYVDALGSNFYWTTPYSVEDIERIEVIRGPASALYGANAFSGVINILTRDPGSDPGTEAHIGVGNLQQVHGNVSNSGGTGGLTYRLSAGYDQSQRYTRAITDETIGRSYAVEDTDMDARVARANGHLRYTFKPNLYADLQAGYSGGFQVFQGVGLLREFQFNQRTANLMGTIQTPWGYLRAFYTKFSGESGQTGSNNLHNHFNANTFDVEATFNRQFHLGIDHNLSIGAAYRLKGMEWDFFAQDHSENHFNGFIQDTMQVQDWLILVGSLRVDAHPLLPNLQISPRGAIIVQPTEGQALRLTYGKAFRTQTGLESYIDVAVRTPLHAVSVNTLGAEINDRLERTLRPETIRSLEAGYRYAESSSFDFDVAAYYNVVESLVIFDDLNPYTLADRANGEGAFHEGTATFDAGTTGFTNDDTVFHVVGGELSTRVYPVRGLDLYANYSYNHAILRGESARGTSDVGPAHLVNAGIQYRAPFGLDLSSDLHFASSQTWEEQGFHLTAAGANAAFEQYEIPAYYLLNARIGYRLLDDDLEVGFSAYNLTNNKHRQHPFGQEIGMRLLGTVAYRF